MSEEKVGLSFYVATSLSNAKAQQELTKRLEAYGHQLTYDWTEHGSVQNEELSLKQKVANSEVLGVYRADMVIALLPGGSGTHVELGIALGRGGRIGKIVVGTQKRDGYECVFYYAEGVQRIEPTTEIDWKTATTEQYDYLAREISRLMWAHRRKRISMESFDAGLHKSAS
jgi:nucleoside 2-deoxyribosyltransferase